MATMNLFLCLPELLVSLVVGPITTATGDSMRTPMMVGAVTCLMAVGLVYYYLVATPLVDGAAAAVGTTTAAQLRPAKGETDEANLLSEEDTPAGRGSFSEVELPVRSKLGAASRDPDVWKAKADEVPPWVAPSSVGKV